MLPALHPNSNSEEGERKRQKERERETSRTRFSNERSSEGDLREEGRQGSSKVLV